MSKRTGRDLAIGLGGGILGALANEHLSARPRIAQATRDAYAQGWVSRDNELQPIIRQLSDDNAQLRSELVRLSGALESNRSLFHSMVEKLLNAIGRDASPKEIEGELRLA